MNRETHKVEKWVKEHQNSCPNIHWEKAEFNAIRPFCKSEENESGKCIYKHCPFNKVKSNK